MLDRHQKQTFAEQGYLVVPRLVYQPLIDAARREIATRVSHEMDENMGQLVGLAGFAPVGRHLFSGVGTRSDLLPTHRSISANRVR